MSELLQKPKAPFCRFSVSPNVFTEELYISSLWVFVLFLMFLKWCCKW